MSGTLKVKSSEVLTKALALIESGEQKFACAAIQDVETQIRWDTGANNVVSKAMKVWMTFKPSHVSENLKNLQEWWPKGDPQRIETLKLAVAMAKKGND
jgi:hypothetical protein